MSEASDEEWDRKWRKKCRDNYQHEYFSADRWEDDGGLVNRWDDKQRDGFNADLG